MNKIVRQKAAAAHLPVLDYILKRIKELEAQTGVKRTLFAACPNSVEVIRASLRAAKRNQAPIKFAATLNQVDTDRGYTGMTHQEFVVTIREEARRIHLQSPVIIAIDHGGPWLKDTARLANLPYAEAMAAVKRSFEAAITAGFDLLHVDPTIDITLGAGESIRIETVVERTLELIEHAERFRRAGGFPKISYEVGTEEVHGGLADLSAFTSFLEGLKAGLLARGLADTWPCFVVGKVGTDLHTTTFDPVVARQLADIAARYGSLIKGHYSDGVSNPEDYPLSGMGAANVGPEFTENEYDGLMELDAIEQDMLAAGQLARRSDIKQVLWDAVIASGRWQKWLHAGESTTDFYANTPARQLWLVKTGCRYIWENPGVVAARARLYEALSHHGVDAAYIVETKIEHAIDRYYQRFNLNDLNDLL